MRIFVGFGYNDRDKWVKDLVFPIVEAFGAEVVTGEDLQGQVISGGVEARIRTCKALIGFATRRDEIGAGKWTTHRWVTDEIANALALPIPVVEVREEGVEQGGIAGDRQRINYQESRREQCLVELVTVIGKWHREQSIVTIQLLPSECVQEIIPIYRRPEFRCSYRLRIHGEESNPLPGKLTPIKGGLFLEAANVRRDALIQVEIQFQNRNWVSGFESIEAVGVMLQRG